MNVWTRNEQLYRSQRLGLCACECFHSSVGAINRAKVLGQDTLHTRLIESNTTRRRIAVPTLELNMAALEQTLSDIPATLRPAGRRWGG